MGVRTERLQFGHSKYTFPFVGVFVPVPDPVPPSALEPSGGEGRVEDESWLEFDDPGTCTAGAAQQEAQINCYLRTYLSHI